jgi:hypothetical protein
LQEKDFSADSAAQAPALDWHVVLQPDGSLDGVIAWNNMQSLAHALGSLNRSYSPHSWDSLAGVA